MTEDYVTDGESTGKRLTSHLASVPFTWCFPAIKVLVVGSFNQWREPIPLEQASLIFRLALPLKAGLYHYKYIVDGVYKYAPDQPITSDLSGNIINWVRVSKLEARPPVPNFNASTSCIPRSASNPELVQLTTHADDQVMPDLKSCVQAEHARQQQLATTTSTPESKQFLNLRVQVEALKTAKRKTETSSRNDRLHVIGKATWYRECISSDVAATSHCKARTYGDVAFSPFEAIVQFSRRNSMRRDCPWGSNPVTPHSVPDSPTELTTLLWYDVNELPYLVRAKLCGLAMSSATFNASDCHDHIQLSHARLCATKIREGMYRSVRGLCSIPTNALVYFEVDLCPERPERGVCVGVSTAALPLNSLVGTGRGSIGWYSSGEVIVDGRWKTFGPAMRPGCTVGVLVRVCPGQRGGRAYVSFCMDGKIIGTAAASQGQEDKGELEHCIELGDDLVLYPTVSLYSSGSAVMSKFAAEDIRFTRHLPANTISLDMRPLTV
mmetsp:Transcript_22631/g.37933  ORF Transcript_22631/g.37933 Transcript_22631/m.37933 type:complete len:495 (+) Transcript_22631:197-1681(+)|eukprot:CAMPEP_0184368656 /NCGR_PEP_ID=MMETSP1089-20130417/161790_1 /TAXON_ID=38269 ORGANISM="Gloeochaete wittrockiana, Strain SAG46.84" /NCGR_SAMPLE_ID=MMETSP1089 /ASSEMBLY_ACC=CAM_ASM_000445 /LENGTH=494 /DNA_ID=CAMNT_0026710975 /DNA_START=116 /DNA_END=1600 /DNA_ORIENTATION=-